MVENRCFKEEFLQARTIEKNLYIYNSVILILLSHHILNISKHTCGFLKHCLICGLIEEVQGKENK